MAKNLRRNQPKIKIPEKTFQKNFMKALKFNGYLVYKQNVFKGFLENNYYFSSGIPEGASDLIVLVPPGFVVFCELKSTTGKQQENQKLFEQEVRKRGGIYLLCTARDSLQKNIDMVKMAVQAKCQEIASKYAFKLEPSGAERKNAENCSDGKPIRNSVSEDGRSRETKGNRTK